MFLRSPFTEAAVLLALYTVSLGLDVLVFFVLSEPQYLSDSSYEAVGLLSVLLKAIVAAGLWVFAHDLAKRTVVDLPDASEQSQPGQFPLPVLWQIFGCAIIVWSFPVWATSAFYLLQMEEFSIHGHENARWIIAFVTHTVFLALGTCFVLGSRGLSRLLWWARKA